MVALALLSNGEKGEVVDIIGRGNPHHKCYEHHRPKSPLPRRHNHHAIIERIGIRPGKIVEVVSNNERGSILIKIDDNRIALGRGVAMKILVRRL
jgi:ferrous iron transport protein A